MTAHGTDTVLTANSTACDKDAQVGHEEVAFLHQAQGDRSAPFSEGSSVAKVGAVLCLTPDAGPRGPAGSGAGQPRARWLLKSHAVSHHAHQNVLGGQDRAALGARSMPRKLPAAPEDLYKRVGSLRVGVARGCAPGRSLALWCVPGSPPHPAHTALSSGLGAGRSSCICLRRFRHSWDLLPAKKRSL